IGYFRWRQPGGSNHDVNQEEKSAIKRRSDWTGIGNQHDIWRGRGARARNEPGVRSGIIRCREGVRRNVALDVSGKEFLDDDSDSEGIWLYRIRYPISYQAK